MTVFLSGTLDLESKIFLQTEFFYTRDKNYHFRQETKIITLHKRQKLSLLVLSQIYYIICNLYMGDDVQLILFHEHFIDIEYSFL